MVIGNCNFLYLDPAPIPAMILQTFSMGNNRTHRTTNGRIPMLPKRATGSEVTVHFLPNDAFQGLVEIPAYRTSEEYELSNIFSDFLPALPLPPETSVPVRCCLCVSNPRPARLPRHPHHAGARFGRHQWRDEFSNERDQFREGFGRNGNCGALQKRSPLRLLSCVA